jgi:hypothetical protein
VKRLCRAQKVIEWRGSTLFVAQCQRKRGHGKRHRLSWHERAGGRLTDITVRWK